MVKLTASEPNQVKNVMMSIVTLENQPILPQFATPSVYSDPKSFVENQPLLKSSIQWIVN